MSSQDIAQSPAMQQRQLQGAIAGSGSSWREALFGLCGGALFGLVSPVIGHPFDTVKTRMQAEAKYANTTFSQTTKQIYISEGIRGFYRGFIPPLVGSMIFRGLLFSAYSGTYSVASQVPLLHEPIPFTYGLRPSVVFGAMAASLARAVVESPFDMIKVRFMIGKSVQDTSNTTWQQMVKSPFRSVAHLYHGFLPTLFRTMGLLGSFFIMVDYSVRFVPEIVNAPGYGPFFKGGVCATAAWCVAFPLESAKSVIQADHTGYYKSQRLATWVALKELYGRKGIKGLYRGFGPGASRSFVANGISMMVYSWFQDVLRRQS